MQLVFQRIFTALVVLLFALTVAAHSQPGRAPDVTLHGSVTFDDAQTYREVPFTVPSGQHHALCASPLILTSTASHRLPE